ncbi:MAG TPA: exo 1,3/1,4-beta-D-glucan glucohydrolase [Steroidobacteraceae bacterium]|jgi:beta-glucosidase
MTIDRWFDRRRRGATAVTSVALLATLGCLTACDREHALTEQAHADSTTPIPASTVHPEVWPLITSPVIDDSGLTARLEEILGSLSVEEKVGQIIQADIVSVTPQDVREYRLGSILNGGNSGPHGDDFAPAPAWLALADEFYLASMDTSGGKHAIPIIWGVDAIHGNSNIIGATLFPHNVGLGAARDPELIRRIGEITAREVRVTGQEWTFAPTLAVVQDVRWGRAYESYSENPQIVREYAGEMVKGLQGEVGSADFLRGAHVVTTAKHFVGDGGTFEGRDQGDNRASEAELRDIHAAGYTAAIAAGAQSVMASFSGWQGRKVTGHKGLLTDVLKGRMGFDGILVGDWNAHGQVEGCSITNCAAAINAGLDMYMAPDSWKGLYTNTLAQVRSGEIPLARLDDAVRRILRVKLRAGLFEAGKPSSRPLAGQFNLLGAPEHRAVARQAARESLVLLKNSRHLLPLKPASTVLVAGDGADSIAKQNGGWTLSWQGTGTTNSQFPHAESIFSGIRTAVTAGGGKATLSVDGSYTNKPDLAIVVFGEDPYAEFQGDIQTLEYRPTDKRDLQLLRKLHGERIPVVAVFLTGRPLWVNSELNASDAFVVAWLPGSEGGAIADVLFAKADGAINHDFKGRLSFSWPRTPDPVTANAGAQPALFPLNYGLTYADDGELAALSETAPLRRAVDTSTRNYFSGGRPGAGWKLFAADASGKREELKGSVGGTAGNDLAVTAIDHGAQEDARLAMWSGKGNAALAIAGDNAVDLQREANGQLSLAFDYRVDAAPSAAVELGMECGDSKCRGAIPIDARLRTAPRGEWQQFRAPLRCFEKNGTDMRNVAVPFAISTAGSLKLGIANVRLDTGTTDTLSCGA